MFTIFFYYFLIIILNYLQINLLIKSFKLNYYLIILLA